MKIFKIVLESFFIAIFLSSCSAINGHKDSMNYFDALLVSENSCDYDMIDEKIKKDDDTILWAIQGGSLARNCADYKKSNEFFDKAEERYKQDVDKDSMISNISETIFSAFFNNNVNDYEGNTYEKIMLNTYKALNFVSLNDYENARVEFNRALDRQRRAKEFFEKEIKEKQKQQKEEPYQIQAAKNSKTQKAIYDKYNDFFSSFKSYPDFINPFTTYISGIYFMLIKDYEKSRALLKESLLMQPNNKQIKSDYNLSRKYAQGMINSEKTNYAWIIYENGQGMIKNEQRFTIPLFLFTNQAYFAGIALPKIQERNYSYKYLLVNGKKTINICNMDNVIKTEFKKRFHYITNEVLLRLIVKTSTQIIAQQKGDNLLSFGMVLYQDLTNRADVRSWSALPKSFQSIRIKLNSKIIYIKDDMGQVIKTIIIPKGKNAIIYVKSQIKGDNKIHEIIF